MTQPKRPADLGPALDLTPEMLDQAAEIMLMDVAAAKAIWIQAAPKSLRDLLNARRD